MPDEGDEQARWDRVFAEATSGSPFQAAVGRGSVDPEAPGYLLEGPRPPVTTADYHTQMGRDPGLMSRGLSWLASKIPQPGLKPELDPNKPDWGQAAASLGHHAVSSLVGAARAVPEAMGDWAGYRAHDPLNQFEPSTVLVPPGGFGLKSSAATEGVESLANAAKRELPEWGEAARRHYELERKRGNPMMGPIVTPAVGATIGGEFAYGLHSLAAGDIAEGLSHTAISGVNALNMGKNHIEDIINIKNKLAQVRKREEAAAAAKPGIERDQRRDAAMQEYANNPEEASVYADQGKGNKLSAALEGLAQPQERRAYHGTTNEIEGGKFRYDPTQYMPDRALGAHFAADPEVSNSFVMERVNGREVGAQEGGRIYPTTISPDAKLLDVPQKDYGHAIESDQSAIQKMIAREAFKKDPTKLQDYLINQRAVPEAEAGEIAHRLLMGERVNVGHDGPHTLDSFIDDFNPRAMGMPERQHWVDLARQSFLDQGYAGLRYKNTSPMEMETAKDPTSYLMFKPDTVKSATSGETLFADSAKGLGLRAAAQSPFVDPRDPVRQLRPPEQVAKLGDYLAKRHTPEHMQSRTIDFNDREYGPSNHGLTQTVKNPDGSFKLVDPATGQDLSPAEIQRRGEIEKKYDRILEMGWKHAGAIFGKDFSRNVKLVPMDKLEAFQGIAHFEGPTYLDKKAEMPNGTIESPINVIEMPDGKLKVIDGHHRWMESKLEGETHVHANVQPWQRVLDYVRNYNRYYGASD